MSYSRWINSRWYTYWSSNSGSEKQNQIFVIADFDSPLEFTFKKLSDSIEECLKSVSMVYNDVTTYELLELHSYMLHFIEDINNEFKELSNE